MKDEAVKLLSQYIQIDTTNPPGNEDQAVQFFADIFDREKIKYKTYESKSQRKSIRAVLPGSGEKEAIILLNHMDVVPVNEDEWSFSPFGGEIRDGYIHGRGALDMKGLGIMELMAFLAMKREGVALNRDLIFLAAADEETGGSQGVGYLLDNHPDDFKADLVINEGGFGITNVLPDRPVLMIASAEKGVCWLKLTRKGLPGHGSMPHGQNALERMLQAFNRLFSEETPVTITPPVAAYFKNLATGWEFFKPYLEDGREETLVRILKESGLMAMPQINAMVRNTMSLNVLNAGVKTNVIPSLAEAELDIRLLPGQEVDDFIEYVREKLADEEIAIEPITINRASESPIDTGHFAVITDVIRERYPDAVLTQSVLMGTSDSRFFRERGIASYGVCPIFVPLDDIKMVHGIDEKISVDNLVVGTEVLTEIVRRIITG
jgi:acetylornithine deacetylase/succinyl-diaminopimelate desuccinylase-like protein